MSDLRKMHSAWKAREKAVKAADKACTQFGVFVWRGDGRYPNADAVGGKLFKSRKIADKAAARSLEDNHVVRSVDVCTREQRDKIFDELYRGKD